MLPSRGRPVTWKMLVSEFSAGEAFHQMLLRDWTKLTKPQIRQMIAERVQTRELPLLRRLGRRTAAGR